MIRTSTETTLQQIKQFLCIKLNLKKEKYAKGFKLWRKIDEVKDLFNFKIFKRSL